MPRYRIPVRVGTPPVSTRSSYDDLGPVSAGPKSDGSGVKQRTHRSSEEGDWRDRALRLQAEMDNYRKRQRRIAQQEAQAEQERLLHDVLGIADNLERTLAAASPGEDGAIRQGVELTRDELLRVLSRHGVERFEAGGEPFDPAWHEAVHVVAADALGVEAGTVVEVVRPGYRKGEQLFRPARVVVAN